MILSLCASKRWRIWGADVKTAFLSGDPSSRDIFFRPPREIKEWMSLADDDLYRLEKAAYGLAEAPRAWFLRLSRELKSAGLTVSQLDPCLYSLRKGSKLLGVCGVHVDDLIGGGEPEMDQVLNNLKKKLPLVTIELTPLDTQELRVVNVQTHMLLSWVKKHTLTRLNQFAPKALVQPALQSQTHPSCEHVPVS